MAASIPLSGHALEALQRLRHGPKPRQEFNPGVNRVLEARSLTTAFAAPTPYRARKGDVTCIRLTEAGFEAASAACDPDGRRITSDQ